MTARRSCTTTANFVVLHCMPTLSVITPCYNHAAYVEQTIRAAAAQSRPPDEYLALDDASTDDSGAIIARLAAEGLPLTPLTHVRNGGAVASLHELCQRATGDYLYAAAADDLVLPGFFARAMQAAREHPQAGLVFAAMRGMNAAGKLGRVYRLDGIDRPRYLSPAEYRQLALDGQPAHRSLSGATVFRRECLLEVGGFRGELGHWCDTFAIQAIALKYGAVYLPEPGMAWRRLHNSLSANTLGDWRGRLAIVERAAALMRSAEFADRFPADYVARWRRRYRRSILLRCGKELALRGVRSLARRAA